VSFFMNRFRKLFTTPDLLKPGKAVAETALTHRSGENVLASDAGWSKKSPLRTNYHWANFFNA
jgi:hypothetical protein